MDNLPKEIINEIMSNMTSCSDILNFCITNSENKNLCKDNALYFIKEAIHKKIPEFNVNEFIEKLDRINQTSKKFSYLQGTGIYQKEFDALPNININPAHPYTWADIKTFLLELSKILNQDYEDTQIPEIRLKDILNKFTWEFTENLPPNSKGRGTRQNNVIDDILNPYKNFEENYKKLKELNLDEYIDIFIRKWVINNNKAFKFESKDYCFNIIPSIKSVEQKDKYILTILCKILNLSKENVEKREMLIDIMNRFYRSDASWGAIEKYMKKYKNKFDIGKEFYKEFQNESSYKTKDQVIEYMLKKEMCNTISLEKNSV